MADIKEMVYKKKNTDLESLKKAVATKKLNIEKLQKEYNSLKTENSECNRSPKNTKSPFLLLKAQIEVLNSSVPRSVPNYQPLLFAFVHNSLRKEVNHLEGLASFQKQMLHISLKKINELKQLCEREQIDYDTTEPSHKRSIEKEKARSEMLECLHRKLARRIRRITKQFYPAVHTEEEKIKKLLSELSDDSVKCNEWGNCIRIDESLPKSYIELLLDWGIVELFEDSLCLKLVMK